MKFSEIEIKHILRAGVILSLAFTIVDYNIGINIFELFTLFTQAPFWITFLVSGFTVGLGFLLHELAHKWFAQKYGAWAEFRAFDNMLFFALIMSFFGFIFAAPGAVMIGGRINTFRNGIISVAGPITNLLLASVFGAIFLASSLVFASSGIALILTTIALTGFYINSWLGLFNMIPFGFFDGAKVFKWNKVIWGTVTAIAFFYTFLLPSILLS